MKVVLVTGGRAYADMRRVFEVLNEEAPDLVIHGDARTWVGENGGEWRGADYFAGQWADRHHVPQLKCPADWEAHGKSAGPVRNSKMVSFLTMLHAVAATCSVAAFPGGHGTADMVNKARRAGFPVREVETP